MSDTQKNTAAGAAAAPHTKVKPTAKTKSDGLDKPKPDKGANRQLQPLHSHTGKVGKFEANPDGVLDRFQLETADKTHTVQFPPHFGQELLALAQPGREVTVLGFLKTTPKGEEHLHLARLDADGATARPLPPTPPATPAAAVGATISGPVAELKLDPKGRLRALHLGGEAAELRLPPHLGEQLAGRLTVGTTVVASGQRRALRPGEVLAHPNASAPIKLELLTVGDESFLLH
jgi:hypothetical protein